MPKYRGYKTILGVIPNVFHPSLLTTYRSLLTAHMIAHDINKVSIIILKINAIMTPNRIMIYMVRVAITIKTQNIPN